MSMVLTRVSFIIISCFCSFGIQRRADTSSSFVLFYVFLFSTKGAAEAPSPAPASVTFEDDAAASPNTASFLGVPNFQGAAASAAGHVPIPSTPALSAAMGPSPPPPKSKEKKLQVTVDKDETTWDQFFIAPEIVKIGNRSIAPLIVVLSSTISSSNDITVFVTNLKPSCMCPSNALKNKPKDSSTMSHNMCANHLKSLIKKKGDAVTYDLFFDLPFDCSPHLATDILDERHHGDIPVVKTYVGTPGGEKEAHPSEFIHTLVLLFEKVDDGFGASKKVTVKEYGAAESSDDSFEWV